MSDMDWNKHLLDKIDAQAATIAEQAAQIEALRADAERLRMALQKVMSWIDNWSPEFTHDSEWPADAALADAAMQSGKAVES